MMYHMKIELSTEEKRTLFCEDQYPLVDVVPHSLAYFRYEHIFF